MLGDQGRTSGVLAIKGCLGSLLQAIHDVEKLEVFT